MKWRFYTHKNSIGNKNRPRDSTCFNPWYLIYSRVPPGEAQNPTQKQKEKRKTFTVGQHQTFAVWQYQNAGQGKSK